MLSFDGEMHFRLYTQTPGGTAVAVSPLTYNDNEWHYLVGMWDGTTNTHLKGSFNCIRHAAKLMIEQRWGRILSATSSARFGIIESCHYATAMAGVVGLTRAVARDLGRYGVTCNCIVPAAATRMTLDEGAKAGYQKRYETGLITKERLGQLLNIPGPEHIPPIVAYLASDAAGSINGQVFRAEAQGVGIYSTPVIAKFLSRDYENHGPWDVDELVKLVPKTLLVDYVNPAPPREDK